MDYDIIEIGVCDFDIKSLNSSLPCILVEPHPAYFERMKAKVRPNCICVQAGIMDHDGEMELFSFPERAGEGDGRSSFIMDGNWSHRYPTFKRLPNKAKVMTLRTLFDQHRVDSLRWFKVDAEMADGMILKQYIELAKEKPSLWAPCIQYESEWISERLEINDVLLQEGYTLKHHELDTIATR